MLLQVGNDCSVTFDAWIVVCTNLQQEILSPPRDIRPGLSFPDVEVVLAA